jgi:hypothetical protein
MKQHPDRQPRRAIAMNSGNDHDCDADYEFELKGIDDYDLWGRKLVRGNGEMLDGRCAVRQTERGRASGSSRLRMKLAHK